MDLEMAKLVAFALAVEADAGVMGTPPKAIKSWYDHLIVAQSFDHIRTMLGDDLVYKFENYLNAWITPEEPEAPPVDEQRPEPTEEVKRMVQEADEESTRIIREGVEALETPAEGPPKPKKQRGKRGRSI